MCDSSLKQQKDKYDPVYLHARREALITLAVWLAGLLWGAGYCFVAGYDIPAEKTELILGMPRWVFLGVLLPWVVIVGFSIWFGLFYIADDELERGQDESDRVHFHNNPEPEKDNVLQ